MPAAFDPKRAAITHRRNLPHMRQHDALYFVTFRTADSVPADRIRQWHAQTRRHIETEGDSEKFHDHVARQLERTLDLGLGACPLSEPASAEIVANALRFFDGERYLLDTFVIMPNHAHAIVCPLNGHDLSKIVQSWKGFTAREINKRQGSRGAFWQDETFDHIVRDTEAHQRFRQYIRNNPAKLPGKLSILGTGQFQARTGI